MNKKYLKYILLFVLTICGLLSTNTNVYAEEYVDQMCKYTFVGKKEECKKVGYDGMACSDVDYTYEFNLVYSRGSWRIGGESTGNVSFEADKPKWTNFGQTLSCPTITVYQRKAPADTKYYILNQDFYNGCKQAVQQTGKDNIKYDGYTCNRIVGTFSGTDITSTLNQSCPSSVIENLKSELNTKYKDYSNLADKFYHEVLYNKLNVQTTSKEEADKECRSKIYSPAVSKSDSLWLSFKQSDFSGYVNKYLENSKCTISEDEKNNIIGQYEQKIKNQQDRIITQGDNNYRECVNSAQITEQEKDELKADQDEQTGEDKKEIEDRVKKEFEEYKDKITSITLGGDVAVNCQGIIGDELLDVINEIFTYVKIAAPILLIVLGGVDFGQAVISDDKDALKKAASKFIKRAVVCVAIFFVPTIINYLLSFIDNMTTDPTCGIK